MKVLQKKILLLFLILFVPTLMYSQTAREQVIQEEEQNITLPELPADSDEIPFSDRPELPTSLDVNSQEVGQQTRSLPNEGAPYFTLSGGLAPYQASLGILKYFIPEWWGQVDINLVFLPTIPGVLYYTAFEFLQPYVAFKVVSGWAFYYNRIFEISLIAQLQVAFISTDDIPIMPALGFRFIIDFFYIDLAVSYAVGVGSSEELLFSGVFPAITVGFRF